MTDFFAKQNKQQTAVCFSPDKGARFGTRREEIGRDRVWHTREEKQTVDSFVIFEDIYSRSK